MSWRGMVMISPLWKKVLYVTHTHACMYIMHACIHAACVQVYSDIRSGTSMHTRTSTHTWSIHAPPTTHKYWTSKHKKAFACFFDRLSHLVYLLCLLQDWKLYVPLEEYYTFVNSIEARYICGLHINCIVGRGGWCELMDITWVLVHVIWRRTAWDDGTHSLREFWGIVLDRFCCNLTLVEKKKKKKSGRGFMLWELLLGEMVSRNTWGSFPYKCVSPLLPHLS